MLLVSLQRPQSTPESNGHGSAPLIVHVDPIPVSTTAEQCMAEPDRPELDHVLFGVARDLTVRGDSPPDLPHEAGTDSDVRFGPGAEVSSQPGRRPRD